MGAIASVADPEWRPLGFVTPVIHDKLCVQGFMQNGFFPTQVVGRSAAERSGPMFAKPDSAVVAAGATGTIHTGRRPHVERTARRRIGCNCKAAGGSSKRCA